LCILTVALALACVDARQVEIIGTMWILGAERASCEVEIPGNDLGTMLEALYDIEVDKYLWPLGEEKVWRVLYYSLHLIDNQIFEDL